MAKKWYEEEDNKGRPLVKNQKTPLSTQAARYTNWLKNTHGDKVRVTSGDRGSSNHSKGNAFDLVGIEKLSKKDQDKAYKTAIEMGLRIGNEQKGKKGVKGWTGSHTHIDESSGPSFTRGGESGAANRKNRTKKENKENNEFLQYLEQLRSKDLGEESMGPSEAPPQINRGPASISPIEEEKPIAPTGVDMRKKEMTDEERLRSDMERTYGVSYERQMAAMQPKIEDDIANSQANQDRQKHLQEKARIAAKAKATQMDVKAEEVATNKANSELIKEKRTDIIAAVKADPNLSVSQKKEAAKHLNSNESIDRTTRRLNSDTQSSSVADQFKEALTFFAPQLLGGLIGQGLAGGDEGFIAGAEQGGQLRDSYIGYKQKEKELDLKKQAAQAGPARKTYQQLKDTYYTLPDGKQVPIFGDPNNATYVHPLTGQALSAEEMQNVTTGEGRRVDQAAHTVAKSAEFSGKQQEVQSGFDNTRASLKAINDLYDSHDPQTGVLQGRYNDLAAMAGADNPRYVALRTETNAAIASFLKTTSGATVSEQERSFLRSIIPTTTDSPVAFESKLKTFKEIVVRQQMKELESIASTQPLRSKTATSKLQRLIEENREIATKYMKNQVGPSQPQAPAGTAFQRIENMSPEKRAAYEEFKRNRKGSK